MQAAVLPDASDGDSSDGDGMLYEADAWAISSVVELRDEHELLEEWLKQPTANSERVQVCTECIEPCTSSGFRCHRPADRHDPPCSSAAYATKAAAKNAIQTAELLQTSVAADLLAAEQASGVTPYELQNVGRV